MNTNCLRLLNHFSRKYPSIKIFRSSHDAELKRFFDLTQAEGSTTMTETGEIHISLNDEFCTKSTLLEEMAHAIQYLNGGQIATPSIEFCKREIEAKSCIVERQYTSKITQEEIDLSISHIKHFNDLLIQLEGSVFDE